MKDELDEKVMTKFVGLRSKMSCYLIDGYTEEKKAKGTKKCIIKQILKFQDFKKCLENKEIILRSH